MEERRVCVGAIAGAFGVRGEVRLKSFCAEPGDVAAYGPLETEDGARRYEVTGEHTATLWYDDDGVLVRKRLRASDGSTVVTVMR